MSSWPINVLILLIGVAGWYYLFYSRAAHRLGQVETTQANVRRIRLRRWNGAAMILLAGAIFVGTRAIEPREHPRIFVTVWLGIFVLLLFVVLLALLDVRLTSALRNQQTGGFPTRDPRR